MDILEYFYFCSLHINLLAYSDFFATEPSIIKVDGNANDMSLP